MKAVGIVSEYNPLHTGHIHHIRRTRELSDGAAVVAVMSGNFVQRGEFAIFDKFARAEAAVRSEGGVDLVVELPAVYAISSAERFAAAGVALIAACGVCDGISFGSETGEVAPLLRAAEFLDTDAFNARMTQLLSSGESYASLRQKVCDEVLGEAASVLKTPNNTLGVEYLRAILKNGYPLTPIAVRREGAQHDGAPSAGEFASASYVRRLLLSGEPADDYLPAEAAEIFAREIRRGAAPVSTAAADVQMMSALRRMTAADFARLPDVSEGLEYRLERAVASSRTVSQCADAAKTKRYAHSRIRRILLAAYLGLDRELAAVKPQYIRVLAANARGRELLHDMRRAASLPVITKPADINSLGGDARRLFVFETLAGDLYALARPSAELHTAKEDLTRSPVMTD